MNALESQVNASIFKLSTNTYIAVPNGHEPPDLFEGRQPILVKRVNLVPGQCRYHLDTDLALAEMAEQGWHVWELGSGVPRRS